LENLKLRSLPLLAIKDPPLREAQEKLQSVLDEAVNDHGWRDLVVVAAVSAIAIGVYAYLSGQCVVQ
jgi:hypothetical protein